MDENKFGQDQNQGGFNSQINNNSLNSNNDELSIFSGVDAINNNLHKTNLYGTDSSFQNDMIAPVSNVGENFASSSSGDTQDTNINVFGSTTQNDVVSPVSNVGENFASGSSGDTQDTNINVFGSTTQNDVVSPVSNVGENFASSSISDTQDTNINVYGSTTQNDVVSPVSNVGENFVSSSSGDTQDTIASVTENSDTVSEQTSEIVSLNLDDRKNSQPVQESPVQTSQINSENNLNSKKEKKKKGKAILVIILLLFLAIIGGAIYFYFNGYSKFVLSRNIAKAYDSISNTKIDDALVNIFKSNSASIDYNMNIDIKDNAELLGGFNNLDIKYTYSENKNDKKGLFNLESRINKEEFVNLDALLKDNKVYFKVKDVMDKYYFTDLEYISLFEMSDNSDSKYISDILKDSILDSIDNKDLNQSNEEIVVNNKSLKTVKISLNIDNKFVSKICKNLFEKIENDDKALEILSKKLNIDKEEIKKEMATAKTSINASSSSISEEKIIYNMYTDILGNAIKHEFVIDDIILEFSDYNDVKELVVKSNGLEALKIKFEGKETGTISGSVMQMISITGNYAPNKINLDIKTIDNSTEVKMILESSENKISDKEYKFDSSLNISLLADNNEVLNANIKMDGKLTSDVSITEINISNSKNFDEITEEEINNIYEKIYNLPGFKVISEIIESSNNFENDSDYDF